MEGYLNLCYSSSTFYLAGVEDGAANGLPMAVDEAVGLADGIDDNNGQVLSAAAAAAAAAATVLPPPSETLTPSSRDLMS